MLHPQTIETTAIMNFMISQKQMEETQPPNLSIGFSVINFYGF